jgi:hypothetical protein
MIDEEILRRDYEKLVSPASCDAASTDIITDVKDAIDHHEETVVKQEEAAKKIEEEKH